jgi:hypothetical protein
MAEFIDMEMEGPDEGTGRCSECDVVFQVVWNNNGHTDRVEFCPFCGDEFDAFDEAEYE